MTRETNRTINEAVRRLRALQDSDSFNLVPDELYAVGRLLQNQADALNPLRNASGGSKKTIHD